MTNYQLELAQLRNYHPEPSDALPISTYWNQLTRSQRILGGLIVASFPFALTASLIPSGILMTSYVAMGWILDEHYEYHQRSNSQLRENIESIINTANIAINTLINTPARQIRFFNAQLPIATPQQLQNHCAPAPAA